MLELSSVVPTVLSILCSVTLILVWILNPKWRTLHNYISIHHILFGTLQLCAVNLNTGLWSSSTYSSILLPASLCWSLCGTILAYARLVLLITGKISYGKRIAAIFSYATLSVLLLVVKIVIPNIFELSRFNLESPVAGAYFIMNFNLLISLRVMSAVVPCCKKRISRTGGTRILSLIGIAIVSDIIILITMMLPFLFYFDFLLNYRLIAHTFIVLFNKSSVNYFRKQRERRNQRALQEIKL